LISQHIIDILNCLPYQSFNQSMQVLYQQNAKNTHNDKNNNEILPFAGVLFIYLRKYPQAEKIFQKWLSQYESHPPARSYLKHVLFLLANVHRFQMSPQRAIEILQKILHIDSKIPIVWHRLSQIHQDLKQYDNARADLQKVFNISSEDLGSILQMAWIEMEQQQFDQAHLYNEHAKSIDNDDPFVLCSIGDELALQDQQQEAIIFYLQATDQNPYLIHAWKNLAVTCIELKDISRAEIYIQKIIALDPKRVEGWMCWGWLESSIEHYHVAIEKFQQGLQIDPYNLEILIEIADLYEKLNDLVHQKSFIQTALRIAPHNADLHWRFGIIYLIEDQIMKARQSFEEALKFEPNHVRALNNLAMILDEYEENFDRAILLFQQALPRDPTTYTAVNLAMALFNHDDFKESERLLKETILKDNQDPMAWFYLGAIARDWKSEFHEAEDDFQKAFSLEPSNLLIAMDLVELYLKHLKTNEKIFPVLEILKKNSPEDPAVNEYVTQIRKEINQN
jgi:tetratricopeptide (TPR) repeat protein